MKGEIERLNKEKKMKQKKSNIFVRIFRFFFPKNFRAEMYKGMQIGEDIKKGKISPKVVPTYWVGKGIRKVVDPKHKMKIGKENEK
jgi:hypothetical protein